MKQQKLRPPGRWALLNGELALLCVMMLICVNTAPVGYRMAPEIHENWKVRNGAAGASYATPSDVFSATIVVWECLSGQMPYKDARHPVKGYMLLGSVLGDAVMAGLRPSDGAIPDGCGRTVSAQLQTLVETGWHLDPAKRPSAEAMHSALQAEVLGDSANKNTIAILLGGERPTLDVKIQEPKEGLNCRMDNNVVGSIVLVQQAHNDVVQQQPCIQQMARGVVEV